MHDKVILILLYVICKEGISDKERQQLIDSAQFTIEETKALTNLGQLGVRLSPTMDKKQDDRVILINVESLLYIPVPAKKCSCSIRIWKCQTITRTLFHDSGFN